MGAGLRVVMAVALGWVVACGGESSRDSLRGSGGASGAASASGGASSTSGGMPAATGFEQRADGLVHRVRALACENTLPRSGFNFGELTNSVCDTDGDCAALKFGYCDAVDVRNGPSTSKCFSGCVEDADCDAGQICHCGSGIGNCVAATCATDADCDGELCALVEDLDRCDDRSRHSRQFACTTPADACVFSKDCASYRCVVENGARVCLERVDSDSAECAAEP